MENKIDQSQLNEIFINFNYTTQLNLTEELKLSDLKGLINKEYNMKEDEYEIYINDVHLLIINQDLKIKSLIETYKTNEFQIKSYKNVFDLKNELTEINDFLDYKIKNIENSINTKKLFFENLKEELEK